MTEHPAIWQHGTQRAASREEIAAVRAMGRTNAVEGVLEIRSPEA
ncbi:hypothetical protein ACFVU2_09225 [Leifsonia sp. NPDC058194]